MRHRIVSTLALVAASAFTLAGCAGSPAGAGDGRVQVVATTNVYGQIAEQIGGEEVDVTSIVTSAAQDPHSFEASARDQLAVNRAQLVIENGGGYDGFADAMLDSGDTDAAVITAVEYADGRAGNADASAGGAHAAGFNEHVWYDLHTIARLADAVAAELGRLRPDAAAEFSANAATFADGVARLESSLGEIATADAGAPVFATEPVPGYLLADAALVDVTPPAFREAVEEGQDVAPATLLEATRLLEGQGVRVVITNVQTGGAEIAQVVATAESAGIPVIGFAETLPEGQTYLSWMDENIEALAGALAQ